MTVHRNQLVEYHPQKENLPPMIEGYVPMDRRQDDFYERFMEQRIQKLNNREQSGMEDPLPFPIESLRTTPITLPQKRVSITSIDSGVNSPHILSPAKPITPDNSQPYPTPSTSGMTLVALTVPIRPLQQFFNNNRNTKNKEPKYNRSQPDHPDPQSVLRTRTRLGYKIYLIFLFFLCFICFFNDFSSSELTTFPLSFQFLTLFQITMPKCHKIYPNCIWHIPSEWQGLNIDSALFTKVYWNYATHIVWLCVSSKSPINPNLYVNKKLIF